LPPNYCTERADACYASERFNLSGFWFWSAESKGAAEAVVVTLSGSKTNPQLAYTMPVGFIYGRRALCVRMP
jgi:hypothetical protein